MCMWECASTPPSGMGFCTEHNAIGNMVTNGESKIITIIAVNWDGEKVAPCGLMWITLFKEFLPA